MAASLPPSLYAETARPPVPAPPLDGDRPADVCIVGGGFTGLSAALHLAEAGAEVVLLERNEPGWGASGRNGGQVNPGLKFHPDDVEREFGAELGGRMVAMAWGAPDALFSLVQRLGIACEASQTGTLRAAFRHADMDDLRAGYEQGARRGWPVRLLDAEACAAATGTQRYLGGLLDPRGGHVNPLGLARGLAEAATRAGAAIHGDTAVRSLRRNGTAWHLVTPSGTVTAERVILATNGYTDDLWPGLRRTVVPVFSAIVASAPLDKSLAERVMPCRGALYELGAITTYYRLDGGNRLLMGGRGPQRDISGPDTIGWLARYAARLWPQLGGVAWTHGWNGQIAITADHYPHLHEPAPGLLACLGYNGRGVALATALGPQLARRIQGGDIDLPVTPPRAISFHGLWKPAVTLRLLPHRIASALRG
jgi:glycine/D-amino acid oxidase-like deaminating enzyme